MDDAELMRAFEGGGNLARNGQRLVDRNRATVRSSRASRARYTSPMAPAPAGPMISSEPKWEPGIRSA
jgi:hypothetical protein